MSKRRTRILILCAAAAGLVLAGLNVLGTELSHIFQYVATSPCIKEVPPAEPGQEVTYVACGDAPSQPPTIN